MCTYYDLNQHKDPKERVNTVCQANTGRKLTNQQTTQTDTKLNYLIAMVGNQNFKKGRQVEIDKAFVMNTEVSPANQVVLRLNYDVGLLLPKARFSTWMKDSSLKPIKLAR